MQTQIYRNFIEGAWCDAASGETFNATNPTDGTVIGSVAKSDRIDAQGAIIAARKGHKILDAMTAWERAALCNAVADQIQSRRDSLASILSAEQGKPLISEAYGEVDAAATGFREAAELIKWMEGEYIPVETPNVRAVSYRKARGVYAVITPWNFPINIPVEYLAPCLAAGNGVVWVPAPSTSACASALMECIVEAGVPEGSINLVHGPGDVVGDEIVVNPGTDGIGFTGSPVTGGIISKRGAGKPMLLELGGNGPVIVLNDADLEKAADAAAFGCFFNAGQVCAATGRILTTRDTHEALAQKLKERAEAITLGNPLDENTTMGPLNNSSVVAKVAQHVADGLDRGGKLLTGGRVAAEHGSELFYAPTVIDDVPIDSLLNTAETFGPVAPIVVCEDDEDLIRTANAAGHGLAAGVFTRDLSRAFNFGERIQAGLVNINNPSCYWELHLPFGGAPGKNSGIGRLGGKHTLRAVTEIKTITFNIG
ncbi:aldehyde dehydrogenase [Sedimentitalea sp. CY04]|uniref:Aldehyde dehydrogenase n=1 Tax=Parasedimentitalea denitrificans TaxID=2211118 RepID=A0ABX0WBS3_9RHOB|nr:aldehyde dehydrogenase family protein [Sedimentitalea sp. CY04]NIZ62097.1 aldehyde dehydrogenase [Sedimentitalea sp. CY04]